MIKKTFWLSIFAISVALIAGSLAFSPIAIADDDDLEFEADLSGAEEVPPVNTSAEGEFSAEVETGGLEFELEVEDIDNVVAAHIHCAPEGVNGPVGVTLFGGPAVSFDDDGTLAEGIITAPDPGNACGWMDLNDILTALASGNTYVNVHTFPGIPSGEIRGQIDSDDD